MTAPIVDQYGDVVGVIQAINKNNNPPVFSKYDEIVITHFTQNCGTIITKNKLYERAKNAEKQSMSLCNLIKTIGKDLGVQSLCAQIKNSSSNLVSCDKCAIFYIDNVKQQLITLSSDFTNDKIPLNSGICGACINQNQIINITDA